jgi:SAM-dependent methyltransferase
MANSSSELLDSINRLRWIVDRLARPWDNGEARLNPLIRPVGEWLQASVVEAFLARCHDGTPSDRALRRFGVDKIMDAAKRDLFPVPHSWDREGYYGEDHAAYWLSGLADFLALSEQLPKGPSSLSVLDFGAASGRVSRHFLCNSDVAVTSVDVNRRNVAWLRSHLRSPRIRPCQTTYFPPLPVCDGSIDFAFAFSVFTHIDDFEEAWLSELHRVLKPGGRALLTFHSERVWEQLKDPWHFMNKHILEFPHALHADALPEAVAVDKAVLGGPMPAERFSLRRSDAAHQHLLMFHTASYVRQSWGKWFAIEDLFINAHGQHQDGVLLRR